MAMPPPKKKPVEREHTTSIGNYLLSKTIGEGTFGKVKVGVHILTGERVAVKVLEKDRIVDKGDVKRVSREIQILKHIQHPNVIHLLEVIEKPRHLYLVTEHINGGELFDYIVRHGRLNEDVGCRLFRQIVLAVDACHAMNVIHRDLKPENMMVDDDLNLKLIDFGLSNTTEGELLQTACGSPCYAAPEMIAGKRYNGPAADIWSLGVCLFAMLCGYLPFEDGHTPTLYRKILNGEFTLPDFISDNAKALISGMLTVDPNQRFTTKAIYAQPWFVKAWHEPLQPALTMDTNALRAALTMRIEPKVLGLMKQVGFSVETVEANIRGRKRNHCTATFFLLLHRKTDAPLKVLRKPPPPKAAAGEAVEGKALRGLLQPQNGRPGALQGAQTARAAGGRSPGTLTTGAWQRPGQPRRPSDPPTPPGYPQAGGRQRNPFSAAHSPAAGGRGGPMAGRSPGASGAWQLPTSPLGPGLATGVTQGAAAAMEALRMGPVGVAVDVKELPEHPPSAPSRASVGGARTARVHGRPARAAGGAHSVGGGRAGEVAVYQFEPPPPLMMSEVAGALATHRVSAEPLSPYSLRCERYGITFDLEVFAAPNSGTEVALTLTAGDRWIFKELSARLVETVYGTVSARKQPRPAVIKAKGIGVEARPHALSGVVNVR